MLVAALDIGSTWTKGACFSVQGARIRLLARAARPTTVGNLAEAFFSVLAQIVPDEPLPQLRSGGLKLQYSSSAKGGLAVAAIGLVPEVTVEIGKIAAQSAGAKLTQVFAYRLTRRDIWQLERNPPDIILFAGGTDGGSTEYVLANAAAIAASAIDCDIVYAGNRSVADEVTDLLADKRLQVVSNLLPDFNKPNPDPARDAIRRIFLDAIVKGKGLDAIVAATGAVPVPTPFAMLEYTRAIREHVPGWDDFLLFDVGGATTDVYSAHRGVPAPGVILRGLPEPDVKRTVEGDLGIRISAQAVCHVGGPAMTAALVAAGTNAATLASYADQMATRPEHLPCDAAEHRLDRVLAGLCVGHAAARHVGRMAPVYTPDGEVKVQVGRDLSAVTKVIGSGGWLARAANFSPAAGFRDHAVDNRGRAVLMPARFAYYRDEQYLFPLLANLARECPEAAAHAGIDLLVEQSTRNAYVIG
jgi:uncharacterized protein (TIGR01319 family)